MSETYAWICPACDAARVDALADERTLGVPFDIPECHHEKSGGTS